MHSHKTKVRPHLRAGPARGPVSVFARVRLARAITLSPSPPERHERSLTALAADAMRREEPDVVPPRGDGSILRGEPDLHRSDPDQSILENEYVGDDLYRGSTSAPDQNVVDEIGRAYGVQEEDSGALRSSSEILDHRDHHRSELIAPHQREA